MADSDSTFDASAYGGEGWQARLRTHRQEIGEVWADCGIDSEWAPLRAVLLHRPGTELAASTDPAAVQMLAPLDLGLAQAQHDAIAEVYRAVGATVHYVDPAETPPPNQMFCADLVFLTPEGAILARPASTVRAGEERHLARRLADLGVPILRTLTGTATFEGADAAWIDPTTVLIGVGLRTNAAAAAQIADTLAALGAEAIPVDLPFGSMHLMGPLRIVDRDLAVAWPRRTPYAAVAALRARGIEVAFLPHEADNRQNAAFNFVCLGPRRILMAGGFSEMEDFFASLDIDCVTVTVVELAKAAGGIGCLSGVLQRDRVGPAENI
jgi:N-dimethylarginine dimethylaminohydrolase